MNEHMESKHERLIKWLRILLYIHVASIANSLLSYLPVPETLTTWVSRLIMVGVIVCMFQLAPVNDRYKKAAIFRTIMLCCTLIFAYVLTHTVILLVASVVSILACYHEYVGHAELVADKDSKLAKNWHSLFGWGILTGILVSFGSIVASLLVMMLEMNAVRTATIFVGVLSIPQLVIDVIYLLYLNKMILIFGGEGEVHQDGA